MTSSLSPLCSAQATDTTKKSNQKEHPTDSMTQKMVNIFNYRFVLLLLTPHLYYLLREGNSKIILLSNTHQSKPVEFWDMHGEYTRSSLTKKQKLFLGEVLIDFLSQINVKRSRLMTSRSLKRRWNEIIFEANLLSRTVSNWKARYLKIPPGLCHGVLWW